MNATTLHLSHLRHESISRSARVKLAESRGGRIALHLLCLFSRPQHATWHLRGMWRELGH